MDCFLQFCVQTCLFLFVTGWHYNIGYKERPWCDFWKLRKCLVISAVAYRSGVSESVTPAPRDLKSSSDLCGHFIHMHISIHAIKNKNENIWLCKHRFAAFSSDYINATLLKFFYVLVSDISEKFLYTCVTHKIIEKNSSNRRHWIKSVVIKNPEDIDLIRKTFNYSWSAQTSYLVH